MDDPGAEQPLGFRRASAGANLPTGVQAVGMEVRRPFTDAGLHYFHKGLKLRLEMQPLCLQAATICHHCLL